MIGAEQLNAAFDPYSEAMGSLEFAGHMAGFEPLEFLLFASQATASAAKALGNGRGLNLHRLLAGVFAVGILVGAAAVRQEAARA